MSANYQATEKLALTFGASYNHAESGMHSISLVAPFPVPSGPLTGFYNPTGDSTSTVGIDNGWENRIGRVEDYSNLEYSQIDLTLGGTYNFTERLYTTCSLTYSDFDSDEEYVYGDENGSSYYGFVGVGYNF